MARQVGEEQVVLLRQRFLGFPSPMPLTDRQYSRYAYVEQELLPSMENMDQTGQLITTFWNQEVTPRLAQGQRLLMSTHGNTLRALIQALDTMSVTEVEKFEIPTAKPIAYRFDHTGRPLGWHYMECAPCIGCAAEHQVKHLCIGKKNFRH